jgi:hypothetical protein
MTLLYLGANALSVAVFLTFGVWCLFAGGMREDFDRFGLSRLRILTGALEVAGALGLVAGYFVSALAVASGTGLALLMTIGLITRLRQRDTMSQMLPAASLIVVNLFIAGYALRSRT